MTGLAYNHSAMIRPIAKTPARVVLLAAQAAALLFLIPSVSDAREKTPTIFYVTGEESRYELRTYHPSRGRAVHLFGRPTFRFDE